MSKRFKSIETDWVRAMGLKDVGEMGMGHGVCFWDNENVSELATVGSCIT